jgi:hypothetical protein
MRAIDRYVGSVLQQTLKGIHQASIAPLHYSYAVSNPSLDNRINFRKPNHVLNVKDSMFVYFSILDKKQEYLSI